MSGQDTGQDYDLREVTEGVADAATVQDGALMNAFCEAMVARDLPRIAEVRAQIVETAGEAAMADAAATIAAFNAYPRAADATGLPLEDPKAELTEGMRDQLGLNSLDVAHRSVASDKAAE
jgi:hypothetical protein